MLMRLDSLFCRRRCSCARELSRSCLYRVRKRARRQPRDISQPASRVFELDVLNANARGASGAAAVASLKGANRQSIGRRIARENNDNNALGSPGRARAGRDSIGPAKWQLRGRRTSRTRPDAPPVGAKLARRPEHENSPQSAKLVRTQICSTLIHGYLSTNMVGPTNLG